MNEDMTPFCIDAIDLPQCGIEWIMHDRRFSIWFDGGDYMWAYVNKDGTMKSGYCDEEMRFFLKRVEVLKESE